MSKNQLTIIGAAVVAAAPAIANAVTPMVPPQYMAMWIAAVTLIGGMYHLYQTPPAPAGK